MTLATLTFLFTDIEGSTRAWQTDPQATAERLARHDDIVRRTITAAGGNVFKHTGDGMAATFPDPTAALVAAAEAQQELRRIELRVRMGVHTGTATERDGDWFGITPSRCARVMAAGHGGQVLVSDAAAALVTGALPIGLELVDVGEHDLRDLKEPERLRQLVAPGLDRTFPPLRTARATKVPRPRTPLVGRVAEAAELDAALVPGALVTLTGAGGAGKTRLALEVARRVADRFPGGAAFVDLASVSQAALVPDAVGAAVGIAGGVGEGDIAAVAGWLADRQLLVVLDNCEHMAAACADLVDTFLDRCPAVTTLATSREPLHVDGEVVVTVAPLPPQDAAELFVQRAGADAAGDPAVDVICRRLDGIPLALELAAARAATMPLRDVLALLDDRFGAFVTSSRRAAARQRTLQAAVDWSYDLLSRDEQALLRAVSVFTAAFDLDDVAAVADRGMTRSAATVHLASLVTKSLVVFQGDRYRLLETVRLYGQEKLAAAAEEAAVRDRHRDRCVERLGEAPVWPSAPGGEEGEMGDHRLALAWSERSGRHDLVVAHAARLTQQWLIGVRTEEGLRWLARAEEVDAAMPPDERLLWRLARAWCYIGQSDGVAAWEVLRDASSLVPRDHHLLPAVYAFRAWLLAFVDSEGARRALHEGRALPGFAAHAEYSLLFDYREATVDLLARDFPAAARLFSDLTHRERSPFIAPWIRTLNALARLFAGDADAAADAITAPLPADVADFYLVDLGDAFARTLVAHRQGNEVEARRWLALSIATTEERYGHVPNAWGIALTAAAVVADGDPPAAATLLAGMRNAGLSHRFEGALVAGDLLRERLADQLDTAELAAAEADGSALTIADLVATARRIAAGGA